MALSGLPSRPGTALEGLEHREGSGHYSRSGWARGLAEGIWVGIQAEAGQTLGARGGRAVPCARGHVCLSFCRLPGAKGAPAPSLPRLLPQHPRTPARGRQFIPLSWLQLCFQPGRAVPSLARKTMQWSSQGGSGWQRGWAGLYSRAGPWARGPWARPRSAWESH